jgi:hypothetical protein
MNRPPIYIEENDPGLQCPGMLRFFLLELLHHTLLEIRNNSRNSQYCHVLADHAHNLPELIRCYKPELLFYYWEVERPCFLRQLERLEMSPPTFFQRSWLVIENEYALAKARIPAADSEPMGEVAPST